MCYVVCLGGWVNQWNNSITLGNCTIWVLNISLVKLNTPFVCNQLQPAIFSLVQLNYAYCCHTIGPICFVLPGVAHLIQFTFKNAGLCMCYVACLGGWVNQWNNSVTSGYCQIRVWNTSAAQVTPPFILFDEYEKEGINQYLQIKFWDTPPSIMFFLLGGSEALLVDFCKTCLCSPQCLVKARLLFHEVLVSVR